MRRLQQVRHALGSQALLTIVVPDDYAAEALFARLWEKVSQFELRFSRFLPESELTRFNQAAGKQVRISSAFKRLLEASKHFGEMTGGVYNPLILPALQKAGYKGSWPDPTTFDASLNYEQRAVVPVSEITIGDNWAWIPADAAVDFGGIGKGYLLDELAAYLAKQQITNYWFSLGGDVICSGKDVTGESWHIAVQHATEETSDVANLQNHGVRVAIATSGITKRKGEAAGKAWHHLIDPRTNRSAETDVLTATIVAPTAVEADVYAKCCVILGSAKAKSFLAKQGITRAVMQVQSQSGSVRIEKAIH